MGTAELRLAGHWASSRPEHGPALHRRHSAAAADSGSAAWPAVGARDPLFRLSPQASPCSTRSAGTRRSSVSVLRLAAGRQPLSPPGGRDVPDRCAWRHPRRLRHASPVPRAAGRIAPPASDARARPHRRGVRSAFGLGLWLGRLPRPRRAARRGAALVRRRCRRAGRATPRIAHQPAARGCHAAGCHGRRPRHQQRPERFNRPAARDLRRATAQDLQRHHRAS